MFLVFRHRLAAGRGNIPYASHTAPNMFSPQLQVAAMQSKSGFEASNYLAGLPGRAPKQRSNFGPLSTG
jgi:hypothetical protein